MQVIVTGCPRSGTRRLQAAFGQAKIIESAHERDADVTISCHLAVDVDEYPGNHEPYWNRHVDEIWHQVRHPLACIPSMAERLPTTFWMWQLKHTGLHPKVYRSRREFASYFWVRWNQETEKRNPCWRFQIEELESVWPEMWSRMGLETPPLSPLSENYKGREKDEKKKVVNEPMIWDEVKSWSPSLHDSVRRMAERYGYE